MKVIKIILRKIKRLADRILGSKADELYWRFRHVFDKKWAESYISRESINDPNRKFIINEILRHLPFENALEIGCASGPNLYNLAQKYPKVKFYGIDISRKAIETGKDIFKKEKIDNVFLSISGAERLKDFKDKSIDLVFTDAVLIYIGPDKIESAIKEMIRVAKKKILLFEWHDDKITTSLYKSHWIHNYRFIINKFIPDEKIKITRMLPLIAEQLPSEKWDRNWAEFGNIIEVRLQ